MKINKIYKNQRNSTKIHENPRKSTKVRENPRKSTKILEHRRKSMKKAKRIHNKSMKIHEKEPGRSAPKYVYYVCMRRCKSLIMRLCFALVVWSADADNDDGRNDNDEDKDTDNDDDAGGRCI